MIKGISYVVIIIVTIFFNANFLWAETVDKDVLPTSNILNSGQFVYLNQGGELVFQYSSNLKKFSLFESLLKIESVDKEKYNLFFSSTPDSGTDLLWVFDSEVEKRKVWSAADLQLMSDTVQLSFVVRFSSDSVTVSINDKNLSYGSIGLKSDKGYRFSLFDNKATSFIQCHNHHMTLFANDKTGIDSSSWYWFIVIIIVDVVIFGLMHLRRRRIRRAENEMKVDIRSSLMDKSASVVLPQRNAIYLFGGLQVYDRNGEEISKRFSPLLKELFVCLLLYSAHNGISNDELIKLLWYDKSEGSAKNNRAVNISKLRLLLENVDGCVIAKEAGYWKMKFASEVFIDYYECLPARNSFNKITPTRIEILAALICKGSFLQEFDSLWMDSFKSKLADSFIEVLLKYNSLLGEFEASETKLLISDMIFSFDSVNEEALHIKCLTYVTMHKRFMAKITYDHFCHEYKSLYGEEYLRSFSSVISLV